MANNTRPPYTGSGRRKEGGFLATNKQDFNAHATGTAFRHSADQTDMDPTIPLFNDAANVQLTLGEIATYLQGLTNAFVTIGDGYASGDYYVGDPGIPDIETAFADAIASTP